MKNRSLSIRRADTQSFPSTSPEAPSMQILSSTQRPKRCGISRTQAFSFQTFCGLVLALATLGTSSCHSAASLYYKFPEYNYAGRPIPPSKLAQRVMIGVTANGSSGSLQIVDALRDIRGNVEDTIFYYNISGYSSGYPGSIFSFPSEMRAFVYSNSDGSLTQINYSTESSSGSVGSYQSGTSTIAIPSSFGHYYGAEEAAGLLEITDNLTGRSYALNLPSVYKVATNTGDTVALAMVRNSNVLYRIFKLNQTQFTTSQLAITATGSIDCQPATLPVYCVVPVPGTYNLPSSVSFSLDGTTAYVLNCGPECGAPSTTTASVTLIQQALLNQNVIPSSPTQPNPMITNVPVPGGVTEALSDGSTLYLAGQKLMPDGLFQGYLSIMNLASNTITAQYPIADGTHTKMLFGDDNTLWIGSQYCATGERAKLGLNYNCLTMVTLGGSTLSPQILPNITPGSATAVVPYPNQNNNQYYYGSLTGLCWVQNYHKMYTAYGGQVHIFKTTDGSEIDNNLVAVQGTALDVAYMDALSDGAN